MHYSIGEEPLCDFTDKQDQIQTHWRDKIDRSHGFCIAKDVWHQENFRREMTDRFLLRIRTQIGTWKLRDVNRRDTFDEIKARSRL
jgi:nuclear transport factor 2 (NTF2) superfamily protein